MKHLHQTLLWAALCAVFYLLAAPGAQAQATANPPGKLTYQGFLTDPNGIPIGDSAPTNTSVIFRIYTTVGVGTGVLKWAEEQTVTIDKGHFSVLLGEGSPVSTDPHDANLTSFFTGSDASDRFIEITVGTTIISPRLQFQPAPYAMLAASARQIVDSTGNPILTAGANAMTFGGTVTAASFNATNVTATNVFGTNVTATTLNVTNINAKMLIATNVNATNITTTTISSANNIALNVYATNITAGNVTVPAPGAFVGNGTIPVGGIIMWSGATVPSGWTLCNGTSVNGVTVPDLRDKFIVSSGTSPIGTTGGANSITLTTNQVPQRPLNISYTDIWASPSSGVYTAPSGITVVQGTSPGRMDNAGDYVTHFWTATRTATVPAAAASQSFENRPAFYALAFIMRIQ